MTLREYIDRLSPEDLAAYAGRCAIALSYLRVHVKYASKDPSVSLMRKLAACSEGQVSITEVLQHYQLLEDVRGAKKKGDPKVA